jgi:Flp pilus assembly protein TadD
MLDDQVKLNDYGATDFVLTKLAADGWTPDLLYARGELYRARGRPEDLAQAEGFYIRAVAAEGAPAEAWRGLGLAALRAGKEDEGRAALRTYLAKKPDAADRQMITMLSGGVV